MAYIGKQPVVGNFVKLDAITTSATATYNLLNGGVAYFPQTANNCIVSLNGVIQSPTSAYTISGSTIVFSDALTASDSIDFILVLGDVLSIGTPSDATVSFAKVTSNLITGATAETSIAGGDSILIYDDSASALRKMTRTNFVAGIGGTNTPAFLAYRSSSNQSATSSAYTKVQLNSELFDTDTAFDNSTNYRFTVPTGKGGKYVFCLTSTIYNTANDVDYNGISLYKNGSQYVFIPHQKNTAGGFGHLHTSTTFIENATAGDYYEMYVYTVGSSPLIVAGDKATFFGGYKIIE
jgi:hypothetical protein